MSAVLPLERRRVIVRGIVQGVGFRPFVYALAHERGLTGSVCNDAEGVQIEVEGPSTALDAFLRELEMRAPPLAVIDAVHWEDVPPRGDRAFHIDESRDGARREALVSPDVATCDACLAELFDPADRRYRYPFINCTNCGPRFTITRSLPYDRASTTMDTFVMCEACRREYGDPGDRRFHAQPNACPVCGPAVRLLDRQGHETGTAFDAIARSAELLREGAILAVKGLGGYHLACDPFNAGAVRALRSRKERGDKPFALMVRDLDEVRELCHARPEDATLLTSPARPIVLLDRRWDGIAASISEDIAPRQPALGIMLAYTPMHHLLLRDAGTPLVMTSGNRTDEPIAYRDAEALEQLGHIADFFLVHNRPIHMRCDDSVLRTTPAGTYLLRRSRGHAPAPLRVAHTFLSHTLACGGELKNTFCLAKGSHAFLSHHIGDLENYPTIHSYKEGVEHYCDLFDVRPQLVAYDLHPDYLSTQYARELEEERNLQAVGVQHHHAHIAACLADNERPTSERVIGVALDGTGYGTDGAVWGGEFFEGSIQDGFARRAHLRYVALPGGAAAIREPWRMAIAQLLSVYSEAEILDLPLPFIHEVGEGKVRVVVQLARTGLNAPPTSSAGRLFDAAGALLGVPGSLRTTYEGQAAVELELAANEDAARPYPFLLESEGDSWVVDARETIAGIVAGIRSGTHPGEISSRFHRTMAEMVVAGCRTLRQDGGPRTVALSGGTFQNMLLLRWVVPLLNDDGFTVYLHRRIPANDGGLSLGQAVLADGMVRPPDG